MSVTPSAADYLKYAAALVRQTTDWTTDSIAAAGCDGVDHEFEVDEIADTARRVHQLAAQFGDPNRYSDGRRVKTTQDIEDGVLTERVWHADPAQDSVTSWRGHLRHDPGESSPGLYEVTCHPESQDIHIRVVRLL